MWHCARAVVHMGSSKILGMTGENNKSAGFASLGEAEGQVVA